MTTKQPRPELDALQDPIDTSYVDARLRLLRENQQFLRDFLFAALGSDDLTLRIAVMDVVVALTETRKGPSAGEP
jgi:hypothetical protein